MQTNYLPLKRQDQPSHILQYTFQYSNVFKENVLPSNLVSQLLARYDSNFFTKSFVCVEVMSKTCVVFFDDDSGSLLDCLGTNATLMTNDNNKV